MNAAWPLFVVALLHQAATGGVTAPDRFVESGKPWEQFLAGVSAQREVWLKTESAVTVPLDFIERCSCWSSLKTGARTLRTQFPTSLDWRTPRAFRYASSIAQPVNR